MEAQQAYPHAPTALEGYDYSRINKTDIPLQIRKPASKLDLHAVLWSEDPQIYDMLRTSTSLEEARRSLFLYLNRLEWDLMNASRRLHPLVESIAREAIRVFKNIIAPRNEKLTGYSALLHLWRIAQEGAPAAEEVDEGFIYEFKHLFKAINGRPDIYPAKYAEGLEQVDFTRIRGRAAGIARSNYLDELARRVRSYIERYPSGLDPRVIEKRRENVKRILDVLGGTLDDWRDYRWHFRNVIKGKKGVKILQELANIG
jgi:lysine 2,3-aminomutase